MADYDPSGDPENSGRPRGERDNGGPARDENTPRREPRSQPVFRGRKRGDDSEREAGPREHPSAGDVPGRDRERRADVPPGRDAGARDAQPDPGAREGGARELKRDPNTRDFGRDSGGRDAGGRDFASRRDAGDRGAPDRPAPPRRDFGDRPEPPRRDFGDRSGPPRRDFGDRSGPPRRDFGDRSGPPRRDFGDRSGPPRRDFGDRSGPPHRSAPEGRSFGGARDDRPRSDRPREFGGRSFGGGREGGEGTERRPRFELRPEGRRDGDTVNRPGGGRDEGRRPFRREFTPRDDGGERSGDDRRRDGGRDGRGGRSSGYVSRPGGGYRSKFQRGDQGRMGGPKKKKKVRVYFHQALTRILLPKLLTKAKYLSPALARQFIEAGRVRVNARVVSSRFYEVNLRKERVTIDEAPTEYPRRISYYIYNKPSGVICEKSDPQFSALFDGTSQWGFPFGRLTKSVSGLVIFSNDPRMLRRQHMLDLELQKEYRIRINKHLTDEQVDEIRQGVLIGEEYFVPLRVTAGEKVARAMWLDITLLDDSYHHIYHALKQVGAEVVRMRRMRIGLLSEATIPTCEWRELSGFEIAGLALQRFMPGELPPEPLPPPRPRLEKAKGKFSRDARDSRDSRDSRGGPRRPGGGAGWSDRRYPPGKKPPFGRRLDDDEDPEERQRREELADSIGNR